MSREIFIPFNFDAPGKIHEVQDAPVYNISPGQLNPFPQVTNCNNMYLPAFYLPGFRLPIGIFDITNGQVTEMELDYTHILTNPEMPGALDSSTIRFTGIPSSAKTSQFVYFTCALIFDK